MHPSSGAPSRSAAWSARSRGENCSPLIPGESSEEYFPPFAASPTSFAPPPAPPSQLGQHGGRGGSMSSTTTTSVAWSRPPALSGVMSASPTVSMPTLSPTMPPAAMISPRGVAAPVTARVLPLLPASVPSATAAGSAAAQGNSAQPPPQAVWKKGLFEKQPFDDNYVDPVHFLQELKKNSNLKSYQFDDVMADTLVIVQQISFVVGFVYMFVNIMTDSVTLTNCILLNAGLFVAGAVAVVLMRGERQNEKGHRPAAPMGDISVFAWQAALFVGVIVLLAPVFQTLTVSYTDDTIWALGILAMFIHLLFSDYEYLNGTETVFSQGVGVNAATFGSVLLASRIQSPLFAAALITFGILCFNLSPMLRHHLKLYSKQAHVGATCLLCGLTFGCLTEVKLLAGLFGFVTFLICFAVPWAFVRMQSRFKNQISGPWDEAKPQNSLAAAEWANAGLLS